MFRAPLSYYVLTARQSRDIDRQTIQKMGIDGFTLMEIAGSTAAMHILADYDHGEFSHGLYLCGKGNNAGDALVVARYLLQHDIAATVVFLSGTGDLSPDAQRNLDLLKQFDSQRNLTVWESWDVLDPGGNWDFIVDGMLGTGLDSNLRGDYLEGVNWANNREAPVFAMDIPTGLHADSGQLMGACIQANHTFAFGGRKQGFYLEDGPDRTGETTYCELPFPRKYKSSCNTFLLDKSWVRHQPVQPGRHKYASGVLYIVAGSEGLTGAAILSARSAWAEGLGAVILVCPRGLLSIYEYTLPSIIKKPVGETSDEHFKPKHLNSVLDITRERDGAVLLGPGLGRHHDTVSFVSQFSGRNAKKTVIDADALWCITQSDSWDKQGDAQWILTPHPGELSGFADHPLENDLQRLNFVRKFSSEQDITILSKGMPGIIGTSSGKCYLTNYNTQYFSRAGSGDVLAGKVSAYLALGHTPVASCAEGLLRGKQKLDQYLKNAQSLPEPKDFI